MFWIPVHVVVVAMIILICLPYLRGVHSISVLSMMCLLLQTQHQESYSCILLTVG